MITRAAGSPVLVMGRTGLRCYKQATFHVMRVNSPGPRAERVAETTPDVRGGVPRRGRARHHLACRGAAAGRRPRPAGRSRRRGCPAGSGRDAGDARPLLRHLSQPAAAHRRSGARCARRWPTSRAHAGRLGRRGAQAPHRRHAAGRACRGRTPRPPRALVARSDRGARPRRLRRTRAGRCCTVSTAPNTPTSCATCSPSTSTCGRCCPPTTRRSASTTTPTCWWCRRRCSNAISRRPIA